jgi:hypothetical protein
MVVRLLAIAKNFKGLPPDKVLTVLLESSTLTEVAARVLHGERSLRS